MWELEGAILRLEGREKGRFFGGWRAVSLLPTS